MKTGMTSVTFREKSVEEVVSITKEANLTGIEWGGDVHVPAGDLPAAEKAAALCREAGLSVLSYGSYFHADEGEDFSPVLASAKALGAPVIRIWAGRKTYEESTPEEFSALASRIREAAKAAAEADIRVGFEFHRRTATQTKEGAVALLKAVNQPNVGCYWQPNPDVTFEEQLAEIRVLAPWLMNVHVFNWSAGNEAHLLEEGKETWLSYLSEIQKAPGRHDLILEFVKDGKDEAFRSDAAALKAWVKKPVAVFVCDYPENVHNVYDSHTMAILNNALELPETIVSSETLEENRAILEPAEYLFSTWGMPALTEEQLAKYLPNLKAAFYSAGSVQHFARPFLKRGIRVFSAWAANAIPVAEYAVAQIILAGKGFYQGLRIQDKEGRQAGSDYNRSFPCNYRTKVGILGAGMIGSHVCQLLKSYDLDVLVYDPFASDEKLAGLKRQACHAGGNFLGMPDHLLPHRKPPHHQRNAQIRALLPNEGKRHLHQHRTGRTGGGGGSDPSAEGSSHPHRPAGRNFSGASGSRQPLLDHAKRLPYSPHCRKYGEGGRPDGQLHGRGLHPCVKQGSA